VHILTRRPARTVRTVPPDTVGLLEEIAEKTTARGRSMPIIDAIP
jgi:hypothetical protein